MPKQSIKVKVEKIDYKNLNITSLSYNIDKSFILMCHSVGLEDSFALHNRILKGNLHNQFCITMLEVTIVKSCLMTT